MKLTSKGQVTIPQEIREKAGLQPYSEVEFTLRPEGVLMVKSLKASYRATRMAQRLKGSGTVKMSTDEIMKLTRGK